MLRSVVPRGSTRPHDFYQKTIGTVQNTVRPKLAPCVQNQQVQNTMPKNMPHHMLINMPQNMPINMPPNMPRAFQQAS